MDDFIDANLDYCGLGFELMKVGTAGARLLVLPRGVLDAGNFVPVTVLVDVIDMTPWPAACVLCCMSRSS